MIEAGPCRVTQLKTKENDGYAAVQLGFGDIDSKRVKKSQAGKPFRTIKEYRGVDGGLDLKAGDSVKVDSFKEGDVIKVSGLSKGKGFQGGG
jgi:LSU ribosomal protein L3P